MKKLVLVLLCFCAFPTLASHIVGGEFEIIYVSGNRYRVNLILYFDELNGSEGAKDPNVNARIFRKRDNALMMEVYLPFIRMTPVSYTQPACSEGEVVTSRMLYSTEITLSPQNFSDAQGYYISWERCCRNYNITNVYSDDPTFGGRYAGQTFYLEFPPVVKDGERFINSSPRLFPPLNDYACPRRPYYVDFGGVDDDGDSLVYSIVTPLNTKTSDALPLPDLRPRPRPYPEVTYRPPFGSDNIMAGVPDLKISTDGFLTVTPAFNGLFVFAVRCEEYRDGIKIGELRRDFQLLVVDKCERADPPRILGKKASDPGFIHENNMSVSFSNDVADAERCIQVQISDIDSDAARDGSENIRVAAIPIGFRKDVSGILPGVTTATLTNGSVKTFDICFDPCPYVEGPFQVGIVAFDDACSLPLADTLRITVNIEPPDNTNAYFTTPNVTQELTEGASMSWPIAAVDDDLDPLSIGVVTDGFDLAAAGMRIEAVEQANGSYKAKFVWDAFCDIYSFVNRTTFNVKIVAEDDDECTFSHPAVMEFKLKVKLPGNASPVISTDLPNSPIDGPIPIRVFESLSFNVFGDDPVDNDQLRLVAEGLNFNLAQHKMAFAGAAGRGHVESPFTWVVDCAAVTAAADGLLQIRFIVVDDANRCRLYKADTLVVEVNPLPPENKPPSLAVVSTNDELPFVNNEQILYVGQQVSLALTSSDPDLEPKDHLVLDLVSVQGPNQPEGYVFERAEGTGLLATTFTWNPECSIFENGVYENEYIFRFKTYDDRCHTSGEEIVDVKMIVRDYSQEQVEFLPPNFVSPDGDARMRNEFFGMVRLMDEGTGALEEILPKDNCLGRFVGISIYNRWGKRVFESQHRDFRWYPEEEAEGVYFYTLTFSDKEYKGSITVRR